MGDENQYDPGVYKRLSLVEKQLKRNTQEQRKKESTERRDELRISLEQNKIQIGRIIAYSIAGIVLVAVIVVLAIGAVSC